MAVTEEQLIAYKDRLMEAMSSEAGTVRDADGTMVQFRSVKELKDALSHVQKSLNELSPTRRKFPRSLSLRYRKNA